MANILKWNFYKKKRCSNCGYFWDYPFPNLPAMSPVQRLFYFEVHLCPHCNSLSDDITQVDKFELNVQNDKQYKQIIKERNIPFSMTFRKEAYKYLLFAYICEVKGDYFKASKAYYMSARVENYQRGKYLQSMLYNEKNDASMLKKSNENEKNYIVKAIQYMKKYLQQNPKDINAKLMLIVLYKLNYMQDEATIELNYVMNQELTKEQIEIVKDVATMKLGELSFVGGKD